MSFLGLRTVVYAAPDLARAKRWYTEVLGVEPYFDQPFYVGFDVGGFELGLNPDVEHSPPGPGGAVAYWGVRDLDATWERLLALGASVMMPVQDVGDGIRLGAVQDPFGNVFGVIDNPKFKLAE